MPNFSLQIDQTSKLEFELPNKVFVPTGTSSLLIKVVREQLKTPGKLLDLGCGIGITGISLHHFNLVKGPLYASDYSPDAVLSTQENCKRFGCNVIARTGSLFEPWEGETFDIIVNDVSGVAKAVADISPWFDNVPCSTGEDGSLLINQVLKDAPNFMNKNSLLFFPILSLSNMEGILGTAKETFAKVEKLVSRTWPLPHSMMPHLDFLLKLNDQGLINIEYKYGALLWTTEIYVAQTN